MNKEEFIERRGEAAYEKRLQQSRDWHVAHYEEHREGDNVRYKKWREGNPDKVLATHREASRKGGKYYNRKLKYRRAGLQGEKERIRDKHSRKYRPFKQLIASDSQIHHEWIPGTASFRGIALVETDPHQYGIIDVIKIIDGKITLLTEKEIREQGGAE